MIKVMIADDNRLTLRSMENTIPWESWGYQLAVKAENGLEAWEQIQKQHPDIVILDIHMPGISGLEVLERIDALPEKPVVILLTAYDNFSYAQAGCRFGVFDYLLKPLDNAQLKMVLDKAADKLRKEAGKSERRAVQENREEWSRKLFQESVSGMESSTLLLEEYLKDRWNACQYALLLIQNSEKNTCEMEKLHACVEETLRAGKVPGGIQSLMATRERILLLLGFQNIRFSRDYDLSALHIAYLIREHCMERGMDVVIGISKSTAHLSELKELYREAEFSIESSFFLENRYVIHYQSVMSRSVHNEYVLSQKMQELNSIINENLSQISPCLNEFIQLIEKDNRYDAEYVKSIFAQIAFSISCALNRHPYRGGEVKTMDMILEEEREIQSMQELSDWLRGYARESMKSHEEGAAQISGMARKVLDYINVHYMEHISLAGVAEQIGVSESHLCRILKSETGETFVNLLNKIRIQKALQLIRSGQYKVYEIAEVVGFSNYAYFYQVFRKITGKAPKDYQ